MKCPKCKKEISNVNVIYKCWQKAELSGNKIINYGREIEETLEITKIECPKCHKDISNYIKE